MADADPPSTPGGGLDFLALAVAGRQASDQPTAGSSSSARTLTGLQAAPASAPAGGTDGVEAASVLGTMPRQASSLGPPTAAASSASSSAPPPPPPPPPLFANPSVEPPVASVGFSSQSDDAEGFVKGEDAPIPAELLEWDDTISAATRVKLGRRARPSGPPSSPSTATATAPVKTEAAPVSKAPKKAKSASGAVAKTASATVGALTSKGKGKAAPASAAGEAAEGSMEVAAAPVVSQKGKFKGLGHAWRKGLNVSGEQLKRMTREEIEQALPNWNAPQPVASTSAAVAKKAPSKKPASTIAKKPSSKAGLSSTVPAKRKATTSAKDKKGSKSKKTAPIGVSSAARNGHSPSPGPSNNRSRSGTADRHGSFSVEPSVPPAEQQDEDDESDEDDSLYCVCQERYDPERPMLACDVQAEGCSSWYHPSCIGIPDDQIDLVGQFICPRCADHTTEQTTWKTKCLTDGCFKSAVPGLTKYCSATCGQRHLVHQLETAKLQHRYFEVYTADAQPPPGVCLPSAKFPRSPASSGFLSSDEPQTKLRTKADDLESSIAQVERRLALLAKRLSLLSLATRRAELIQLDADGQPMLVNPVTGSTDAPPPSSAAAAAPEQPPPVAEYNPKRKKSKYDSGPAANRVCGFDSRLVLGEVEWAAWVASDEGRATVGALEDEVEGDRDVAEYMQAEGDFWCAMSKKRCDAHSAWPKIRSDDFTLERKARQAQAAALRDTLATTLAELEQLEQRTRKKERQLKDEEQGEKADEMLAEEGTLGRAEPADQPMLDKAPPVEAETLEQTNASVVEEQSPSLPAQPKREPTPPPDAPTPSLEEPTDVTMADPPAEEAKPSEPLTDALKTAVATTQLEETLA